MGKFVVAFVCLCGLARAQDPTGVLEGLVTNPSAASVSNADVVAGGPLQAAVRALPWTEAFQLSGPGLNFTDPYNGQTPRFATQAFVRPATVLTVQPGMAPPYSQKLEFFDRTSSGQRLFARCPLRWKQGHASAALH